MPATLPRLLMIMGAALLMAPLPTHAAGPNETILALCVPLAGPGPACACSVEAIEEPLPEAALHDYLRLMRGVGMLGAAEHAALAEAAARACRPTPSPQPAMPALRQASGGTVP